MRSHELTLGRTFVVVFDHGEDFSTALAGFCRTHDVRQGYIPAFIAGFSEAEIGLFTVEGVGGRGASVAG